MTQHKQQSRIKGAIFVVGAQAVVLVLGFATHFWLGRALGAASYGVFGVVLSIQSIFSLFLTLGIPVAISRFVAQDEQYAQSILRQGLRLQVIAAIILAILVITTSPVMARLLGDSSLTPLIIFSGLVILSQAFYPAYTQFLNGMHLFTRQAMLTSFYAVMKLIGALTLLYTFHIYGAFAGFMVGGIIAGIVGWATTRSTGGHEKKTFPMRSFLSFAGLFALVLVALQILISLDLFMVKALLKNDEAAGYYNAAVTLSRIPYNLLQALGFILLPSVAKLTKPGHSHDDAAKFIADTMRYLIALIVPSVALAAATSKGLTILFYSIKFIPAAPILTILMIGLGGLGFYLLLSNIVAGAGKPSVALYITCSLLVLSGLLGFILIPQFGLMGAAWQTTITALSGLLVLGVYTFKKFKIPVPIHSTVNILIASVLGVGSTYFWRTSVLTLPLQYVVAGVIYIAVLWILGEVTIEDRRHVASIHPWFKKIAPPENSEI